jgi:1-acyl-sn-glycerol-3-phosphate acyltransferase
MQSFAFISDWIQSYISSRPLASTLQLLIPELFPNMSIAQRLFSHLCRWLVRGIFLLICRTKIVYLGNLPTGTGYILASNHISHFDPPFLGSRFRRYVDWMAMEELFRNRASAILMEWLGAFKVRRDGTDRTGIRTAMKRLEEGRVVGVFPEGGIRAGKGSVLEGAAMWPGASALSVLSGKPIVPSVIIGTDRLYDRRNWFRFRRVAVWIGFGETISPRCDLSKRVARELMQDSLSQAFVSLKERLVLEFRLAETDLPATPQARKREDYLP